MGQNKEIAELQAKVKELQERLDRYEKDPSANFYATMVEALNELAGRVKDKTLNLEETVFDKSLVILAKESKNILALMQDGRDAFIQAQAVSKKTEKDLAKADAKVAV